MSKDLTLLLEEVNGGNEGAYDELAAAVQQRLRAMAARNLANVFGPGLPGVTIQPTVLADDTFMKLIRQRAKFDSEGHFFAIASRAMRRLLLDYCRRRRAAKRGHGLRVSWDSNRDYASESPPVDFERLDKALSRLAELDPRKAQVVQYRIFWGLDIAETAEALEVGHATVERDWDSAKTWIIKELGHVAESPPNCRMSRPGRRY